MERFRAEMKLSDWLLVLPDWGLGQVADFTGLGVKKLRHINMECGTKRVRLPLPCGIFIGGGYVFQEAEQRGGSKVPVFGSENTLAHTTQSSATCCQDMLRNSQAD